MMENYLNVVAKLEYEQQPPYSAMQSRITETLEKLGCPASSADNFRIFHSAQDRSILTAEKTLVQKAVRATPSVRLVLNILFSPKQT